MNKAHSLFSGARPSSAAASSASSNALKASSAEPPLGISAPEDGRTPLNAYPMEEREKSGSLMQPWTNRLPVQMPVRVHSSVPCGLLICLALTWGACFPAQSGDAWRDGNGYRFRELPAVSSGRVGFSRLPPSQTGANFTNVLSEAKAAENRIRLNGSGVTLGDVDGDGRCDIFLCGLEGDNGLYRNLGGWRFSNVTVTAGVACAGQFSTGATLADAEGDGDLDLFVNGIGVGTRLYLNNGQGVFTEATQAGLVRRYGATTSTLADIDGDGNLDLYVANYRTSTIRTTGFAVWNVEGRRMIRPEDREDLELTPDGRVLEHGEPHFLYRSGGGGKFSALAWTNGVFLDEIGKPLPVRPRDWGLCAMFRDLNGDGAPDLYVCNDFHSIDRVWINDGRGRFRAMPRLALRHSATFSMAVDVADLNRDGLDDIVVADMLSLRHSRRMMQMAATDPYLARIGLIDDRPQFDRNVLQLNRGDGTYGEVAYYAGLEAFEWTWSVIFLDVDLDGYEDLLCSTGHMFDTQDLDAEARIRAMGPWRREQIPNKLLQFPRMQMNKVAFRNRRDLTFEETGSAWGFDESGVSHGMALGDLDNDGDLDVVVNNMNEAAGLYRNESDAPRIAVRLKGLGPNTRGIGAKIRVYGGAVAEQSQEMICGGRYMSSDEAMRVFAAGSPTNEMRVEVNWRSGKRSVISGVKANRIYEIDETGAESINPQPSTLNPVNPVNPVYEDVSHLIQHRHHEEGFNDFVRQPLLPKKLSQLGPGVAWHDLDDDGWEELIIGSGKGGKLAVYRNDRRGGFERLGGQPWDHVVTRDQGGVVGLGHGVLVGSANYEDGLAVGASVREFIRGKQTIADKLPGAEWSVGPLALVDLEGDGDLDLFVGGRVMAGRWPEAVGSRIWREEQGQWVPDEANSRQLERVGLVSGAVWTDLDGDGFSELVLACEWGPVRVFANQRGQLKEVTKELGLDQYAGWWNGVTSGDLDGDGRLDIIASNWGLNSKYRGNREHPRTVHYGDLDGNGTMDLVEAYYDEGMKAEAPERDLNAVGAVLPWVREKFPTYAAYGQANVRNIYAERLQRAATVEAHTFATMVFLNRGGRFEAVALPAEAQFSPAFAVCVGDMDGDGNEDIFLSQNFFAVDEKTPRQDAGRGLWLRGDGKGHCQPVPGQNSGVKVYGEQRGSAVCDYDHDGRIDLVVTQNGAETKLFHNIGARPGLRVKLLGPAGNPEGIGAQVRLVFGRGAGPAREIHAGSGYWSADSAVQVLGSAEPPTQIQVRWPGGASTTSELPAAAREVEVVADGSLKVIR